MKRLLFAGAVVAGLVWGGVLPARAELGGKTASVQADQVHMKGALRIARVASAYQVHEIQVPNGTLVREYVASDGTVFGVAWNGPYLPDLRQLLGVNFQPYLQHLQTRQVRRAPVMLRQSGLVVESGGHLRSFAGRAYLPDRMPQGITPEEIR